MSEQLISIRYDLDYRCI